ncbi:MAG: hypothetical protein IPQ19_15530 [Bacteroidetes bacterium]|nr:hypothetical protein [Bacteroidota bacterium]
MKNKILILGVFLWAHFWLVKRQNTYDQIPEGQLTKVVFKQKEGDFDFIKALPNGNILAIGETNDSIKLGTNTYYANGNDLVFVIFDKSGNILKSHLLSLPSDQYFIDADVALDGSIYFAFNFSGTINLGSGNLVSNGGSDICLTRFNSNLETLNAFSYGSSINDFSCNISVGKNNDLFIIDEMRDEFSLHGIPVSILSGRSTLVVMKVNSTLTQVLLKHLVEMHLHLLIHHQWLLMKIQMFILLEILLGKCILVILPNL